VTKLLDCTFRDGGYQTNWYFDVPLVEEYLRLVQKFGVEIVEIGFRSNLTPSNRISGPFLFSEEKFLNQLSLPESLKIAVMINADEILNAARDIEALFVSASESRISLVRVATRLNSLEKCQEIAIELQKQGYEVAINLMEASPSLMKSQGLKNNIGFLKSVDYFFLADSFGVLAPDDIAEIDGLIRGLFPSYGLHLHDNRGLAYANSLVAVQKGIQWIDATTFGLGRGAGNLRLEQMLIDSSDEKNLNWTDFSKFLDVIQLLFKSDSERSDWGTNALYFLGAKLNIHPNAVVDLIRSSDNSESINMLNRYRMEPKDG
jgi:4-hydroxy 2-oxovalerate aldolase